MKILVVNCRSVKNKKAELQTMFAEIKPDLVIGTESWLDPSVNSSEYFPDDYHTFRKDRNLNGGGTFICVSNNFIATEQKDLETECEAVWVQIELAGLRKLLISSFYRLVWTGRCRLYR